MAEILAQTEPANTGEQTTTYKSFESVVDLRDDFFESIAAQIRARVRHTGRIQVDGHVAVPFVLSFVCWLL